MAAIMSIGKGYDPDYLTKSVGAGAENYYLSAVREHGEPPGYWSGKGAEALGLTPGSEVDPVVMEKVYGEFLDPRDPKFLSAEADDDDKAHLGRKPAKYTPFETVYANKIAAEPEATEERKEQLRIQAKKETRQALQFFDLTFSPSKSVTLLHAGLLASAADEAGTIEKAQAARRAAEVVEEVIKEAAATGVEQARTHAGWARVGYHGKKINGSSTGRWMEGGGWVAASFFQHTSRNGDPQLHVHQAVLNRQQCADGEWRSLDGQAIYRVRAQASAIAERTLTERLTARLGIEWTQRADGQGWEVEGVAPEQVAEFSTRRVEVSDRLAELAAAYEVKHGYAPNARVMFRLAQQATKDTKTAKKKLAEVPTAAEEITEWEQRTTQAEIDSLTAIPGRALFRMSEEAQEQAAAELGDLEWERVIAAAIADAQREKATFSEYELTRHISRHLPACLGGQETHMVQQMLHELTQQALDPSGQRVLRLSVPDVVDIPAAFTNREGASVFRDPTAERWTTPQELAAEQRFVRSAAEADAPAVEATELAGLLGWAPVVERQATETSHESAVTTVRFGVDSDRAGVDQQPSEAGHGLGEADVEHPAAQAPEHTDHPRAQHSESEVDQRPSKVDDSPSTPEREKYAYNLAFDQVAAVYGFLTSGRRIDVLEGYAGTGKSYTVARGAELWRQMTQTQVTGLTTAQNAAYVLQDEGLDTAWNITRWLNAVEKGTARLEEDQLLVVDEASMVTNDYLTRIQKLAEEAGAKILLTGDSEQLSAPGAGGLMRYLAAEQGSFQLTEVRRFRESWEREASVRLRVGDEEVLADYDRHGRLRGGTRQEMENGARDAYLADHLRGRRSLLLSATNDTAVELSAAVRAELVRYGLVDDTDTVALRDRNRVGIGDLVTARQNDRKIRIGDEGRQLTNRDVLKVQKVWHDGRVTAQLLDKDGAPGDYVIVPANYAKKNIELAYAGTAHSAQGRTVDTCHAVVEDGMSRQMLYVEMTRGRQGNWAWVVTETEQADLRPEESPTPDPSTLERERTELDTERSTLDRPVAEGAPAPTIERGEAEVLFDFEPAVEATDSTAEHDLSTSDERHAGTEEDQSSPNRRPSTVERDAIGVLADVLGTDQADQTAIEAMRAEVDRVTHMAHLGSMWTSVVQECLATQTSEALQEMLPADIHARLAEDPARGSLITTVRRAALAGYDSEELLRTVVNDTRGWAGARSIGQVLTARITDLIGTGEATPGRWIDRTPRLDNTLQGDFVRQVAEKMDERVDALGAQALADAPSWLTEHLGEPDEEIMARTAWQRRAGQICAYREQYGNTETTTNILGAAPDRHSPEQRAAWQAANAALGRTRSEREIVEASDGQLWAWRAAYEREARWAPPHVADDTKAASIEATDRAAEAVRLRAQAAAVAEEAERAALEANAAANETLAHAAQGRREQLLHIHDQRQSWYDLTEDTRNAALRADAELHRRHSSLDLPPLHQPVEKTERAPESEAPGAEQDHDRPIDGQETLFDVPEYDQRPDPETDREIEAEQLQRRSHVQDELDLGLLDEPAADGDDQLRAALEQATQAKRILAARQEAKRESGGQEGVDVEQRRRDERYHDTLAAREEAELLRRRAEQERRTREQHQRQGEQERTYRQRETERGGPELSL